MLQVQEVFQDGPHEGENDAQGRRTRQSKGGRSVSVAVTREEEVG
jgi:hypothetical protein